MPDVQSPGDIYDAAGVLVVAGASMPAGAAAGNVVTSDANGNLSLQEPASNLGAQVAYNAITANISQALTSTYAAVIGAPSITLPNDGNLYRLELTIPLVEVSAPGIVDLAIATGPTGVINAISTDIVAATRQYNIIVPAQRVTGSGQVVTLYALCSAATTLTVFAGAGGAVSLGPCELAAYRVG